MICLDNVVKGHSYLCDISLHADLKITLQPMDSRQFKIVIEKKVLFKSNLTLTSLQGLDVEVKKI